MKIYDQYKVYLYWPFKFSREIDGQEVNHLLSYEYRVSYCKLNFLFIILKPMKILPQNLYEFHFDFVKYEDTIRKIGNAQLFSK